MIISVSILKLSVEYYIVKPVDQDYLYYTIKNFNGIIFVTV